MTTSTREFLALVERNLRFECLSADSTLVRSPHTTGWRVLPTLVVAQVNYAATAEFKAGKTVRIESGQTVAIAPGVTHNLTKLTRRAGYSHWSHFQCEVFPGVSLFSLIEPPLIIRGNRSKKIGQINHELGKVFTSQRSLASVLNQQALGWELITTLLQSVPFKEDRIDLVRHASRLTPVLSYIEENLAKPLSHALLARTASLSPSRFHFLFRSALGCAPYEYVQRVRLKKAQELLIRTDRSVAEIGRDVGHPDPYHFSRMFRRSVGASPIKYRKQMAFHSF
jgi:AraC-like DNA-binding protein